MVDLLVKNGKVVFPDCTIEADIAVENGKIVAIGLRGSMPRAEETIDARGKYVLPGGIDPHTHIANPFMGKSPDEDFFIATKATAKGGTTTIIDFAIQKKGKTPMQEVLDRRAVADDKVVIDYSLHPCVTNPTPENLGQLKELIDYGLPSFKLFLVYRKEGLMVDDGALMKVFELTKAYGGLVGLHAENVGMIEYLIDEALKKGNTSAIYHALTRPPITEAEAVNKAIYLANYYNAPYYNFHLSIKKGVDLCRKARNTGRPIYAETCTHYLVNTIDDLRRENGINFICTPPLRTKEDQNALWEGLADGSLSLVSSDHCYFTSEQKKTGKESFDKVPNGMPGHEFRMPILFSEGVVKGRISVNRFSEITSTNAAKIFGIYPQKGIIRVGSDADIVIIDPKLEKKISAEDSLYGMDWCPAEGLNVKGWPVVTISKGKVIWDGGFRGKAGEGKFLKRVLDPELFKYPIA
ncbi:dihydropyrimidinase [Candidatus Bathyarchaeota archaeon]|nr:dihydropyrimidinase [Candidatus Bathyarchaeota archaeon]